MSDISPPDNSRQICPNCNDPVAHGRKFCESCGTKINASPHCFHCGAPISKGIKFCESCGMSLDKPMTAKPSDVPLAVPAQIQDIIKPQQTQQLSKVKAPIPPLPNRTLAIIGIGILIVLALGAYVVILPVLTGTDLSQKNGGSLPGSVIPTSSLPSGNAQGSYQSGGSPLVQGTIIHGPTQIPPPNLVVIIDVERDPISGIVTATFNGGAGQYGVRDIVVTLTRSDGQQLTQTFKPTTIGRSVSLQGTKMTDRVEVTANYFNGDHYKILDQILEYKKR
jgi:hypothetical protein